MITVVGCGGTGSFVAQALAAVTSGNQGLLLVDGDKVEKGNLARQILYRRMDVGKFKADVLATRLKELNTFTTVTKYVENAKQLVDLNKTAKQVLLVCCADNHNARRYVLEAADELKIPAIIGGNEHISAEAYAYFPHWKGTPRDPRVYYEIINFNDSRDPLTGCGAVAGEKPQTVIANMTAAAYMVWLFNLWILEVPTKNPKVVESYPYKVNSSYGWLWPTALGRAS
jgi:molybdopterin/thiamine biosynthesis adenylyltransferase